MSSKLYEKCPSCKDRSAVLGKQCLICCGVRFIETGLTTGQFDFYHRKSYEEYERGLIEGFERGADWHGTPEERRPDASEYIAQLREECRQRREAAGLGEKPKTTQSLMGPPPGPPNPPRSRCGQCSHAFRDHDRLTGECLIETCECLCYMGREVG